MLVDSDVEVDAPEEDVVPSPLVVVVLVPELVLSETDSLFFTSVISASLIYPRLRRSSRSAGVTSSPFSFNAFRINARIV